MTTEQERFDKCTRMLTTCKTKAQLHNAIKWVNLFVGKYGGFSWRFARDLISARAVMMYKLGVIGDDFEVNWED